MFRNLFRKKPLKCVECDHKIVNERYYNILGDTYCQSCADEYIKDEIMENFSAYRDELAQMIGVQVLEEVE